MPTTMPSDPRRRISTTFATRPRAPGHYSILEQPRLQSRLGLGEAAFQVGDPDRVEHLVDDQTTMPHQKATAHGIDTGQDLLVDPALDLGPDQRDELVDCAIVGHAIAGPLPLSP